MLPVIKGQKLMDDKNYITEDEALLKYCPKIEEDCLGSDCMMWVWQDPQYESAVMCATIIRCRLCGHEVLAGTEDVPVDRVPPLDHS